MDDYSDIDAQLKKLIKAKLSAYNKAAVKFMSKVENGQARSKVTYQELRDAFLMPEDIGGYKL